MSFQNTTVLWNCNKVNKKVLDCFDNMMTFWKILSYLYTMFFHKNRVSGVQSSINQWFIACLAATFWKSAKMAALCPCENALFITFQDYKTDFLECKKNGGNYAFYRLESTHLLFIVSSLKYAHNSSNSDLGEITIYKQKLP